MIAAAKAGDKERKNVLSALVSAVMALAIDEKTRDNISEELVGRAVTKERGPDRGVHLPLQCHRGIRAAHDEQG